jgi:hypothetical protein
VIDTGGVLAWDESRRAHLALLAVTGQPAVAYHVREKDMSRDLPPAALPSALDCLEMFLDYCGGDEPCRFDHNGDCQMHGPGTINGLCVVPLAARVVEAERASERAAEQAAGSEPPEPPPLSHRITLAQLWEALDNDKFEVICGVLAKANSSSRAERAPARRIVAAAVHEWFEGSE